MMERKFGSRKTKSKAELDKKRTRKMTLIEKNNKRDTGEVIEEDEESYDEEDEEEGEDEYVAEVSEEHSSEKPQSEDSLKDID
mmetsp:Transcript_40759/g.62211  ORF Transcript_40759/g.62211 Transcript_40759/m.62211 type:complete len:83 (-) Transcript_40759:1901-2149(-)